MLKAHRSSPKSSIFTSKDPFTKIVAFALIVGLVFVVRLFLLAPSIIAMVAVALYFGLIILLEAVVFPNISPQAIIYAIQSIVCL